MGGGNAQPGTWYDAPFEYEPQAAKSGDRAYYGHDHTPKGLLKVLYVFVQFEGDYLEDNSTAHWPLNSLPNFAHDLLYESSSEFAPGNSDLSVSNWYYQHSRFKGPENTFRVLGHVAPLIKISPAGGNIPEDFYDEIYAELSDYFTELGKEGRYDTWYGLNTRTNEPKFAFDNSNTPNDNFLDYIVIQFRWPDNETWRDQLGLDSLGYGAYAGVGAGTITDHTWNEHIHIKEGNGHVQVGMPGIQASRGTFLHEFAHNVYMDGHYASANGVVGEYIHRTPLWSMMRPNYVIFDGGNAWERYLMNWLDITHDVDGVAGYYDIGDCAQTNEAMRVKIPNTDQYLWFEYHLGESYLDERHILDNVGGNPLPQPVPGIYAYIEDMLPDREDDFAYESLKSNGLRLFNTTPNSVYTHDNEPQNYPGEWWGDVYTFEQQEEEAFSGFNPVTFILDDYNGNDIISWSNNTNSGKVECHGMLRHPLPTGFTYDYLDGETAVWPEYTSYSAFTNPPIINHVKRDVDCIYPTKLEPYLLHDLEVQVAKMGRKARVFIFYSSEIKNDVTFTNNVAIPENTSFQLVDGKNLYVKKSGMPNRVIGANSSTTKFIDESSFIFYANSSLTIPSNSSLTVKDGSHLYFYNESKIEGSGVVNLQDESKLIVTSNSNIDFNNLIVNVNAGATIVFSTGSTINNLVIEGSCNFIIEENVVLNNSTLNGDIVISDDVAMSGCMLYENTVLNSCALTVTNTTFRSNITINGNCEITGEFFHEGNTSLEISDNSVLSFNGDFTSTINTYTDVILNTDSEIKLNDNHKLTIKGSIDNASGTFVKISGSSNGVNTLKLENPNVLLNKFKFENLSTGTQAGLYIGDNTNTNINNCSFENSNCKVRIATNTVEITNSSFNFAQIHAQRGMGNAGSFELKASTIENCPLMYAVYLDGLLDFTISNNTVEKNSGHGIYVTGCNYQSNTIELNNIYNNVTTASKGLLIYNSSVIVKNNTITNNEYGIGLYHNSVVELYGDKVHSDFEIHQTISNNIECQVLSDKSSFPDVFRVNVIQDNGSSSPLIEVLKGTPTYNVQYNCWGRYFDPVTDLRPVEAFDYSRPWDCGFEPLFEITTPEEMYKLAQTQVEEEYYIDGDNTLKQIVEEFPESNFAGSAMKMMVEVAGYLTNGYENLISYLTTNQTIQNFPELKKLAKYIVAEIEIKRDRLPQALSHYEDIIIDPPSYEDSVYAVIDAGKVILMMEEGKTSFNCKLPELIPESEEAYAKHKDYLLSTLRNKYDETGIYGEANCETLEIEELTNKGFSIYPNPFTHQTTISYVLNSATNVEINLYDATGKLVSVVQNGIQPAGQQVVTIDGSELLQGVYYVAMKQEGQEQQVRKLVLLK